MPTSWRGGLQGRRPGVDPCRPQAFDLKAVEMTAELVQASGKPAFVLFMGGRSARRQPIGMPAS
jgi:hypothetical protein